MKLYQVVVYTAEVSDPGAALPEGTPISEIIEFTLANPPANENVFSLLKQYEVEREAAEIAAEEEGQAWHDAREGNGYSFGTIGAETR